VLRYGLDDRAERGRTRSELEDLFLSLCRRHGLPEPEVNTKIEGVEVDFLWREQRLVVETDGYRFHSGRIAFEDDRRRDLHLRTHGLEVMRVSYEQVTHEFPQIAKVLSARLASGDFFVPKAKKSPDHP
jgi:very-short-patch-repair endonuclease